ncbi:MAG TPA: DUF4389 domain-containing protein [Streptosporangiaceae bacterium]
MSDIPAWPSASGWTAGQDDRPAPILLAFSGPLPQRRLTVLFRFILFIPHYFVLYVLSIAAGVIAVIGWFGALFAGHLPGFAAEFLAGYLRWQTRALAYLLLLTGEYPPFALNDAAYPVRIALRPGRLNRLAVFFRVILAIPAAVVATLLLWGACTIVLFVTWVVVLVAGRMPETLYAGLAAVLRYQARYSGYILLLTSAYPSGLFGDHPDPAEPWSAGGPGGFAAGPGGFAGPVSGFATDPSGFPAPGGAVAAGPGLAAPGGWPGAEPGGWLGYAPAPGPAGAQAGFAYAAPDGPGPLTGASPQAWRLVLSDRAKRLVALFLVLGVLLVAGYIALIAVVATRSVGNQATANNAAAQVQADFGPLNQAMNAFGTNTSRCRTVARPLACVTAADRTLANSFDTFAAQLRTVSMPAGAAATAATQLGNAATRAGLIFHRLGAAKTAARYQAVLATVSIDQAVNRFAQDYQALGTALNQA